MVVTCVFFVLFKYFCFGHFSVVLLYEDVTSVDSVTSVKTAVCYHI